MVLHQHDICGKNYWWCHEGDMFLLVSEGHANIGDKAFIVQWKPFCLWASLPESQKVKRGTYHNHPTGSHGSLGSTLTPPPPPPGSVCSTQRSRPAHPPNILKSCLHTQRERAPSACSATPVIILRHHKHLEE